MNASAPVALNRTRYRSTPAPHWQHRLVTRSFALATAIAIPVVSYGASQTWVAAPVDSTWVNGLNWSGGAAPGDINAAGTANTADIATFNTPLSGLIGGVNDPIVIDASRNIRGITFDTAAVGPYVIGSLAGNRLSLTSTGTIQLTSTVESPITFNAPLRTKVPNSTNALYTFLNNATSAAATLTFAGPFDAGTANTRPVTLTLDGSNTGDNLISGVISNTILQDAGALAIVKNGTGKWILSGANNITAETDVGVTSGGTVNNGTLVLRDASALGAAGNQAIVNGGVLQIDNLTLINNNINLNATGEVRMNGSGTANGVIVGASATPTISTTSVTDVFTIGIAPNRLTGGSGATLNVAGPGTVALTFSSNYAGGWSFNGSGATRLDSSGALGAAATTVAFGPGSAATLQLNGNDTTIGGLSTNAAPGAIVENGLAIANTLTVNNAAANTFGGVLRDGPAGTLALTKGGAGTLTLTGSNTYTGGTTVSAGTLLANNLAGSATGTGAVTVNGSATLGGTGFISGAVSVASAATLSPGAGVGTLTLGALTLDTGASLNYEFTSLASYDRTAVSGTLSLGTGVSVNVNSAAIEGTYDILTSSDLLGTTAGWSVTNGVAGYGYAFSAVGDNVRLTITLSGIVTTWAAVGSGSWGDNANWTNTVPNAAGATAQFLGAIAADSIVTLDGNKTVGSIVFNNANRYTIASGSGGSLIMNNNGSPAQIDVTTGSHTISAPVSLADNFRVNSAASTALTISGAITESGGPKTLTKLGAGELILPATNGFTGGVHLDGGTVEFGSLDSLGAAGDIGFNGGALRYGTGNTADISARLVTLGAGGATINTNGSDVTFVNSVGNSGLGGLTKAGAGTLTPAQFNTYLGSTTITGGTLSIASNDSLGDGFTGAGVTLNGGTLRTTLPMALDNFGSSARPVSIGAAGGTLEVDAAATLTVPGTITGSAPLTKSGLGVLALTANNSISLSSPIAIEDGEITLGGGSGNLQQAIGTGPITFRGGTLTMNGHGGSTTPNYGVLANALDVPAGETGTLRITQRGAVTGTLTGAGTLNLVVNYVRGDLNANWSAFTGQINVTGGGGDDFRLAAALNIPSARLHIGDGATMYQTFNPPVNGETVHNIGELSGTSGAFIGGNPVAGRFSNWTVGALGTNSIFAGTFTNGGGARLTKVGAGTLELTGANTHFGRTLVSDGTLALGNVNALQDSTLDTGFFGPQQVNFTVAGTNTYNLGGLQGADDLDIGANSLNIGVNNENTAFSGILTGSGALTKVGTGILALSGTNTYPGGTTVSGGMLTYQNVNAKPATGTTSVGAAGSLGLGVGDVGFFSSADVDSLFANTLPGVSMNPASGVGIDTSAGDFTYATNVSGIRPLTKAGINTLTLTGANTYTGLTTVNQGTLIAPTDTALGSGIAATAGLLLNPTAGTAVVRFTSATPAIASLASAGAGASSVILGDGVGGIPTTLTVGANGATATFTGSISDNSLTNPAAIGSLTKVGSGTLALSGANTYTGPTLVNAGTLRFVTRTALYNAVTTNWTATNFTVEPGAALAVNVGGAGQFTAADLDQLLTVATATGGFKSGSFAGIDMTAADFIYGSVIANPNGGANVLGLVKSGANVLTLTAANTYTGGTRIDGGTLAVDSAGALGTTGAISFGGGTLRYTANNTIDYSSRFSSAPGQAYSIDTNFQTITLASGLSSAGGSLTKLGEGTLNLAGTNTYNGPTTVSAGTLQAGSTTAFGNTSGVTLTDVTGVTLDLNGNNVSIGSLAGGGPLGGNVTLSGGTLTTGGDGASTIFAGMISGAGGLTKVGVGTQTLTGFNTYEGATTVSGGKLVLAQSFTTAAGIVIGDAAVLELGAAAASVSDEPAATLGIPEPGLSASEDLNASLAFDSALGSDYTASGAAAVPEPGAVNLMLAGALALVGTRRRRARLPAGKIRSVNAAN